MFEENDERNGRDEGSVQEQVGKDNDVVVKSGTVAEKKSNNSWMLWVMTVILAVLIGFFVYYIATKPTSNTSTNNGGNTTITDVEDKPWLKVGDVEVMESEITERALKLLSYQVSADQLNESNPQYEQMLMQAKQWVTELVIDELVVKQKAKKEGIELSEGDLAATARMKIESDIKPYVSGKPADQWSANDTEMWNQWIASQGFADEEAFIADFVNKFPTELEIDTYKERLYGEQLRAQAVDEAEAREWFIEPGQIQIAHILASYDPTQDPESKAQEALTKITNLKNQLNSGADFMSLAAQNSDDPSAAQNGGNIGWYNIENGQLVGEQGNQLVPEFESAALELGKNQVSDIVQTQYGYHIIKIIDARPNSIRYDLQEGIRIATINFVVPADEDGNPAPSEAWNEAEEKAKGVLSDIKSGKITFTDAVSQYSEEQLTKSTGGELPSMMATDASGFFWVTLELATQYDGMGMYPYEKATVEKLWGTPAGSIFPEPINYSTGWLIGKTIERREAKKANFNELGAQVVSDLTGQKKAKFEQDWIVRARAEFDVVRYNDPTGQNP
ncbi:MAG TPA: peptidylprolyl isomerase [Caldisericia bacterium]|nr:peptidylprolyl isomerase [Caldisericia bacterium]HPF48157.1 peptidylprolyl isomerase [Caldisericia bacterium]HPI83907.1 peptidylprolyl isomerase [Caldisericia bacterium]HPQ92610.1 peptidylprolyl isomerase [Caldisericia bacterium]HRV74292.1 peptidylprolyl isomerase [Caldisericia bacterium]